MSDIRANLPKHPYGAVYYRVSNPPREAWERDYRTASEDGNNAFRHWFLWSAIEHSPGQYTWDDYDRQLDLAAENGMKTIVAEMTMWAPEWTVRLYPHARLEHASGRLGSPRMHASCATGGIGMCLDNDDLRKRAEDFLRELAGRYRVHPGLGGYDIWNECNYSEGHCYCDASVARFRRWAENRYGSLQGVREAWRRYSLAEWDDVVPPRELLPYADSLDWLEFTRENAYELMKWRADVLGEVDPDHAILAHGLSLSLNRLASGGADDWKAASLVEGYGLTWGSSRHGDEPWKQPRAMDLIRNASRGKPFWHAEAYGGPLWMASNVLGKPRDEGRICYPEDIRYWNLTSYMHGATGVFFLRWRPLLDGILFGAFGPYGMDGSRTDRSEMSTNIAKWVQAPEQEKLWKSRPVKGEVGILFLPDSQALNYVQQHDARFFSDCYEGAYRGFFDNNIQADFVHIDDIDDWRFLYLPFPVMMREDTAARIKAWVSSGGTLISEGCPAYWGDRAHVGEIQPNQGLDEMFGARETYVEFTPDILDDLKLNVHGVDTWGGIYLQCYEPTTGTAIGWYEDGRVAAVENQFGSGKTLLIGSMPGRGYMTHDGEGGREFYRSMYAFGGDPQMVAVSDKRVRARIHDGDGGTFLWIANPCRIDITVVVTVSNRFDFSGVASLRGADGRVRGNTVYLTAPGRDVTVFALE